MSEESRGSSRGEPEAAGAERFAPGARAILGFVAYLLLFPVVLFLAAGYLAWPMAWIFVVVTLAFTLVGRLVVLRRTPDLLQERARFRQAEDVKGWDCLLAPLVALVGPLLILLVAGLQHRFQWPPRLPLLLQLVALLLVIVGFILGNWAMIVNRFFSADVRIQRDRQQTVVDHGPYAIVRHPAYAGALLTYLALPLMLDALWALLPALLTSAAVIVRTALEDRTLRQELDGYSAYARRVPYSLLPGIW